MSSYFIYDYFRNLKNCYSACANVWTHWSVLSSSPMILVPMILSLLVLGISNQNSLQNALGSETVGHLACTVCLKSTHRFSMMFRWGQREPFQKFQLDFFFFWSSSWWILRYVLDHCPVVEVFRTTMSHFSSRICSNVLESILPSSSNPKV